MGEHPADRIIDLISRRRAFNLTKMNDKLTALDQFQHNHYSILSEAISNINSGTNYTEACGSVEALAYKMLEFNTSLREIDELSTQVEDEEKYSETLADCPSTEKSAVVLRALELQDELCDAYSKRREANLHVHQEGFKRSYTSCPNAADSRTIRSTLGCEGTLWK